MQSDCRIKIFRTENGDPLENVIAERINGILKEEYLKHFEISSLYQAEKELSRVFKFYHVQQPHFSIGLLTGYNYSL